MEYRCCLKHSEGVAMHILCYAQWQPVLAAWPAAGSASRHPELRNTPFRWNFNNEHIFITHNRLIKSRGRRIDKQYETDTSIHAEITRRRKHLSNFQMPHQTRQLPQKRLTMARSRIKEASSSHACKKCTTSSRSIPSMLLSTMHRQFHACP